MLTVLVALTCRDVQSYDEKLPNEIYEQYMAAWGKVNLVPEEVRLEGLIATVQSN
ncbi:hypothetical protein [Archaeoglobus veneficus]|uniref:hypothetical protein n=1 Tax=Archaeoglobus veneficus TaxID=58290 RepID=UPI0012EA52FB|nr:hypothetical protein [Archaeoglobus veneficus]